MMRTIILAIALLLLDGAMAAQAADRALLNIIGYSKDGRYFAFEEFGIHDGSGAPYSAVTVLDLNADPSQRLAYFGEEGVEDDLLPPIRAKVMGEAADKLKALAIDTPAQIVSMVGDAVAGANSFALRFGVPGTGPINEIYDDRLLTLETFPTSDTTGCFEPEDNKAAGFSLMVGVAGDRRQVYSDDANAPPAWRKCPLDYRLYGVALPMDGDITQAVGLISVYTIGWEGMDRGFIAVPIGK